MTLHVDSHVEEMLSEYQVASADVLRAIAGRSPTVVETLSEARKVIRKYFGSGTPAHLMLQADPEIRGSEPIVVEVRTPADMKDAFERLERFDEEWWLDAGRKESAEICILTVPQ